MLDDNEVENTDVSDSDESAAQTGKKNPEPVPYARFQQVVQQRRTLETKLNETETARISAETAKHSAEAKLAEQEAAAEAAVQAIKDQASGNETLLAKYREIISSTVNDMTTDWPEEAKMFDPGADADPLLRLEWAQKAKLLVAKLQSGSGTPGTSPKPTPKQQSTTSQEVKSSIDVKRRF